MHASRQIHGRWVEPPSDPAEFAAYLKRSRQRDQHCFIAKRTGDKSLVGVVNINNVVRGGFHSGYLGYYVFRSAERQGLMTEAVQLVIDHAFGRLGLHRLEANIQPDNEPSLRLVQRLGFQREGFSPRYLRIGGVWRDHERWAILADS